MHVFFSLTLTAEIWSSTWLCVCDAWEKNCEKAYLGRKVLLKIVTNSFPKKICFKFQVYKKDRSQVRSTHSVYMFLEVKRIKRISGLRHLYYCTRSEVKLNIARQNGYAKQNIILLHFLANKPHGELSGITKKKNLLYPGYSPWESTSWMSPARQSIAANPHIHSYILCNKSSIFIY